MVNIIRITYDSKKVERFFADYNLMWKKIGGEKTKSVKKHIDRIRASVSFQSFIALGLGRPHQVKENLAGLYSITLTGNFRLIVKPVCDDFGPDSLRTCSEVIVKGVGDYHGGKIEWLIP